MKNFMVVVEVVGHNTERDHLILSSLERRDRRLFGGTGFNLVDEVRDLIFDTSKKEIAQRLQKNLRLALKKNKIRGKVMIINSLQW